MLAADLAADLIRALDPVELFRQAIGEPDPWQADILRNQAPRVILNCSRQSGKSATAAAAAVHAASFEPDALVLLVSPTQRQSSELHHTALQVHRRVPGLPAIAQESALRAVLANGSRIISLPGSETSSRGYSAVSLLVVDEASRVSPDLWTAVSPTVAVSGGRILLLSTPRGRQGFFFDVWTNGGPEWVRIRVPAEQCSRIPADYLARQRETMLGWEYAQEFGCSFEATSEALLDADAVRRCLVAGVDPLFGGGVP